MRPLTYLLASVLAALLFFCMTGCATVAPKVPEAVTVIVERYKPLPNWATEQLPKPMPENGQVQSHLKSENARGEIIDYANCRSVLLVKLDKGEAVNKKDCEVQR